MSRQDKIVGWSWRRPQRREKVGAEKIRKQTKMIRLGLLAIDPIVRSSVEATKTVFMDQQIAGQIRVIHTEQWGWLRSGPKIGFENLNCIVCHVSNINCESTTRRLTGTRFEIVHNYDDVHSEAFSSFRLVEKQSHEKRKLPKICKCGSQCSMRLRSLSSADPVCAPMP